MSDTSKIKSYKKQTYTRARPVRPADQTTSLVPTGSSVGLLILFHCLRLVSSGSAAAAAASLACILL